MNCPDCFGRGFRPTPFMLWHTSKPVSTSRLYQLCDECHGYGVVHCCDGLVANELPTGRPRGVTLHTLMTHDQSGSDPKSTGR